MDTRRNNTRKKYQFTVTTPNPIPDNEAINFITTVRAWGYEIVSKTNINSGVTIRPVNQSAKKLDRSLERWTDKGDRQVRTKITKISSNDSVLEEVLKRQSQTNNRIAVINPV